jgi:hypothetical protein
MRALSELVPSATEQRASATTANENQHAHKQREPWEIMKTRKSRSGLLGYWAEDPSDLPTLKNTMGDMGP